VNILKSLKSPGMGLVEEGIPAHPAQSDSVAVRVRIY
jgi:hypothetical protein